MKFATRSLGMIVLLAAVLTLGGCCFIVNKEVGMKSAGMFGCGCSKQLMLASPSGKCFVITVDDEGNLDTKPAPCRGMAGCKCGKGAGCKCGKAAKSSSAAPAAAAPQGGGCPMMGMKKSAADQDHEPMPMVNIGAKK